ncbi:MAG: chromate transporter [Firmicutes bacterium]|nr:chromate transporter [Bacillota bacterium]
MIYLLLAWEYFKIGLFMIGGGLAALPLLFQLTDKYDWFTVSQLTDMVAISESTPGPLAINMATYSGYTTAGVAGAAVATVAILLPSVLVSLLLCRVLARVSGQGWLEDLFRGLRPAVAGLIAAVSYTLLELAVAADGEAGFVSGVNWTAAVLFLVLLAGVFRFKKHPIVYIGIGAAAGILLGL